MSNHHLEPAPGWEGGFIQEHPEMDYPNPNLHPDPDKDFLPMLGNMDNIDKLQRQQGVEWPEFSWQSIPGDESSRCFQRFSPYISRLGYTNEGRVYSIICPQQGFCAKALGCLNVEVTVTGQRGWVDEERQSQFAGNLERDIPHDEFRGLAADMTVEGTIWFSPSAMDKSLVKFLAHIFNKKNRPFPSSKANGIKVTTHHRKDPNQKIFPVLAGETTLFESPDFARHPEAWGVGNVEVEIGPIKQTGDALVDEFNQLIMDVFNMASGNMLAPGNLLTWNVWFNAPKHVDQEEWRTHAERWRKSIDADHGSPTGPSSHAKYFDGSPFEPGEQIIKEELDKLHDFLRKHL